MCEVFTTESGNLKDFIPFNIGGSKTNYCPIKFKKFFCHFVSKCDLMVHESANSRAQ